MSISPLCVGIDVSKHHLDLFDPEAGSRRIANAPEPLRLLAESLRGRACLAVFEATGHYDTALRRSLDEAGVAYARVNPQQARDFARAIGQRAQGSGPRGVTPGPSSPRSARPRTSGRRPRSHS